MSKRSLWNGTNSEQQNYAPGDAKYDTSNERQMDQNSIENEGYRDRTAAKGILES